MTTNRILTNPGWQDRVRNRLGVDEAVVSDYVLEQPDIITVAEADIIAAVPDHESLTGDDRVYLEAATVCACALQVIVSMPARLPHEVRGPHSDVRLQVNWPERATEIQEERDRHLGRIQTETAGTPSSLTGFWLAGPQR